METTAIRFVVCSLTLMILQGCASIVSGTNQIVSVDTPGCPAAACELSNDKGKWYVNATPGTTTVSRAYGPLAVSCKSRDVAGNASFNSTTKGMAFGNILFGGVIGAGVDVASGAAYDYPPTLLVPMSCTQKQEQVAAAGTLRAERSRLKLGIHVENLTSAVAVATGQPDTDGVIVTSVDPVGTGQALGLKVGHILVEVNGKKINNYDALSAEVDTIADEADVELVVVDAGRRLKFGRRKGAL